MTFWWVSEYLVLIMTTDLNSKSRQQRDHGESLYRPKTAVTPNVLSKQTTHLEIVIPKREFPARLML